MAAGCLMLSAVGVTLPPNANIAFACAYQVVWCPRFGRGVSAGRMETRLKEIIAEKGARLVELETMSDHVRLLVEVDPQFGIHRLVKAIRGRSSGLLRQEFPWLRSRLPTVRTNGHRWRGAVVGDQTLYGRPEEPVGDVGR
jgi:putative transposase